jgi:CheY-like chemotaxis protein
MGPETLARAVEPFYSTKETGRGTGLGLSMVHGLAAQLGGAFALTSAIGEGTRADLYLPVAEQVVAAAAEPGRPALTRASERLRILLVDDDDVVRCATAEMMRDLGHEVIEAAGGGEALDRLGAGLQADAVVTDYKMPRLNGAELARRVKEMRPGIPVLIVTGYIGTTEDISQFPRLAKPFNQADIAAALAGLFDPDGNVVQLRTRRSRAVEA